MSKINLAKEQHRELVEDRNRLKKNISEKRKELEDSIKLNKTGTAQDLQKEIEDIEDKLTTLNQNINEYEKAIKEADEATLNKAIDYIKKFGKDYNLRWIADMSRFISLKNEHGQKDKINLVYKQSQPKDIVGILNIWSKKPGCFDEFNPQQIRYMCEKAELAYESLQVSFNKDKWSGGYSFNLMNVMRDYWIKIDKRILDMTIDPNDECMQYNKLFDDWMYCLNGGKNENILHTKEFAIQKLLYPEQFTDSGSLNPYYTGTPGGNGKGILVIVLASLFTPMSIVMSRAKEMSESFNSRQQGKIFNIIDEGDEGHISQAVLKKRSGSEEIVIEGKGLEPVTMDRTESMIIFDNSGNTVELKGPGEDRRWSIIETNLVMIDYFSKKMNVSREESAEICAYIAEIAKDRNEVTKLINAWMYELIQNHKEFYTKHKRLPKLVALHGQDYQNRLNSKKDTLTELFEDLFPVIEKHGFIPFKWLRDIAETKIHNIKDKDLSDRFDDFMKRKGYGEVERLTGKIKVLYRGEIVGEESSCKYRRIKKGANEFEFSNICNQKYGKGISINENMLDINIESSWKKLTRVESLRQDILSNNPQGLGL